jgi:uncharacterized repeat protein (TIGR03803 family)
VPTTTCIHFSCSSGATKNSLEPIVIGAPYGGLTRSGLRNWVLLFALSLILATIAPQSFAAGNRAGSFTRNAVPAVIFATLHSFCAKTNCSDGEGGGGLVQGIDGNFYGGTGYGGIINTQCPYGCGVVFKITPKGVLTTIYSFCSLAGCTDGTAPGSLLVGADGYLYGITVGGGAYSSSTGDCPQGCGTIFKMTTKGALTTLHTFDPNAGFWPSGLIQGVDGNFYGTSSLDIFSTLTVQLFSLSGTGNTFTDIPVGNYTIFRLYFQGTNGTIYGTTTPRCDQYCETQGGTVFGMTPQGVMTTLADFCPEGSNCTNGSDPDALVRGADGNFYGTTRTGGNINSLNNDVCDFGCGTVFKLTPAGVLTTLYAFCSQSQCMDGAIPGNLIQATDGNFYGVTEEYGGAYQQGTIFEITPGGVMTTLYNFDGYDGTYPDGLIQGTNGLFYGTNYLGGNKGWGTVFDFATGLGAFVETLPASGKVGTRVIILGTDLTGVTAVSFDGTPASFKVVSATEITTTVPTGAASGTVKVTTPNGTLLSNVKFLVP